MTTTGRRQLNRSISRTAALVAAALATVIAVAPAGAAEGCGKRVINDWYGDGRVDGTYALHCYDDAIEALPRDVRDYSSAKEDIERAMQARMRGDDSPPATSDPDGDSGAGGPGGTGKPGSASGNPVGGDSPGETGNPELEAIDETAASDSIPVPLLVLAGLALLLVAAGSAGYLARRLQARRVPPGSL